MCDGVVSICRANDTSFTFIVKRLKLGFIPSAAMTDLVRATTKLGEVVSETTVNSTSSAPVLLTSTLSMTVSRSMTNTFSDFQFSFTSNRVAIDPNISFSLPLGMSINGQCAISANIPTAAGYTCVNTSSNSILISHSYSQNLMISSNITYTISITNVTTPVSVAPLTYSLDTTYNQTRNQRFSTRYAMQSVLPLQNSYSKSNDTINQDFTLNFSIVPATAQYDSWQVTITKSSSVLQGDWVPAYNLTQNATHYLLDRTGLMPGNSASIRARNSLSTVDPPQFTLSLFQAGFLAQQAVITHGNNSPVVLGCSVELTNRTVSMLSNMTIQCDRNSNGELGERFLLIQLPTNGFNYSLALLGNVPINASNPLLNISLTIASPRIISIIVTNVQNLNFVPSNTSNPVSSIIVTSVAQTTDMVLGRTQISSLTFTPNDAYDIRTVTSSRSNTKSSDTTNLTINYPTVLGTAQHLMHITLPLGQNTFSPGTSGCLVGASQDPCSIVSANSTDIRIMLRPNATVVLTRVLNSYPNSNNLSIRILTNPDLQIVE